MPGAIIMDCGCSRMRKIDVGVSIFATRRKTDLMLTCLPSSLIIDELKGLQASNNAPIAYYYCDYRTQVTQPLTLALGHILRLLVERLSMLPGSLRELFESCHREGRGPSPLELEHLICDVLPCQSSYILVDAMDEFSVNDPAQTAQFTEVLDSFAVTGARVLVTSRTLPTPSLSASHIVETHTASNSDIRSFVAHELYADDLMVDILNNELEAEIMSTITEQSQGMYDNTLPPPTPSRMLTDYLRTGFSLLFSISELSEVRYRDPASERHYQGSVAT